MGHYFGSTAFNWVTGATREEVIAKLAKMAGADTIKRAVKNCGGVYCWTCFVGVPQGTAYAISYYKPEGVPLSDSADCMIINARGKVQS